MDLVNEFIVYTVLPAALVEVRTRHEKPVTVLAVRNISNKPMVVKKG